MSAYKAAPKPGQFSCPLATMPTDEPLVRVHQKILKGDIDRLTEEEQKCMVQYDPTGEWYELFRTIVCLQIETRNSETIKEKRRNGQRANRALKRYRHPIIMCWEGGDDIVKDPFLHFPITHKDYQEYLNHRSDEFKQGYDAFGLFAKISTVPETSTITASLAKYTRTHSDIRHFNLAEGKYYPIDVEEEEEEE